MLKSILIWNTIFKSALNFIYTELSNYYIIFNKIPKFYCDKISDRSSMKEKELILAQFYGGEGMLVSMATGTWRDLLTHPWTQKSSGRLAGLHKSLRPTSSNWALPTKGSTTSQNSTTPSVQIHEPNKTFLSHKSF